MRKQVNKLLAVFHAALDAVAGNAVVKKEILNSNYPDSFHVISIGKAADAMFQGVLSTEAVGTNKIISALVISKHGHISKTLQQDSRVICIESDHPVPKESSLKAGQALLKFLQQLPKDEPCVFLISGGTSSLVEVLQENWDLAKLQELTDYLLANAYPINEINAVRKSLSRIKGGGLWPCLGKRDVYCLMISDVPDNDPAVIGSGLLFPTNEVELPELPEKWCEQFVLTVKKSAPENFNWKIVASLDDAKKAAAQKAQKLGYETKIIGEFIEGEAIKEAVKCVDRLKQNCNTLFIWGGETTVNLPDKAGLGGRNQHLALAAAIEMDAKESIYLLAAGTDGSDGLSAATGATVDGKTVSRGLKKNLNAMDYLINADSNSYFQKVDGLIETGTTGTNVMDLVIGICYQE